MVIDVRAGDTPPDGGHLAWFASAGRELRCLIGPDMRLAWINGAWEGATGLSATDLRCAALVDIVHPDDWPALRTALAHEGAFPHVTRFRAGDGSWRVAAWCGARRGADGGWACIAEDVTERLRIATQMAELERATKGGGWEIDLGADMLHWSPGTFAIHEIDPTQRKPQLEEGLAFYPEEGRRLLEPAVERLMTEGSPYDLEAPFDTARGRRIWVRVTARSEMRDGAPVRVYGTIEDVTERRARDDELERLRHDAEAARSRLEDIIRGSQAGTWEWNVQTGETRFNERWAAIIGRTLDEISPTDIGTWLSHAHPDDLAASEAALKRHFAGEAEFYECEARMRHRDGHWVWVLDRGRVSTWTPDGQPEWMFGIHLDITERKSAEAQLAASEAHFRTLVDALPDGVALIDADDRTFRQLNPAAMDMLHLTAEGAAKLTMSDIEVGSGSGALDAIFQRTKIDGRAHAEVILRRADGGIFPASVAMVTLQREASPAIIAVIRDISDLRRQAAIVEEARRAAESANRAKSTFLANMSHEIRTPMNGMMGMADILANVLPDPHHRQLAEVIKRSCEALVTIVNDILDFSKIEAGKLDLEMATFRPADLAARIDLVHGEKARGKGLSFHVTVDDGAARARLGDIVRVTQILDNLVSNAVKFTANGSVRVAIHGDDDALRLSVADSGIGMTEAQVERLFEAFAQADETITRRFGGTGLGMSIVRRLAELMGGEVAVESQPGCGTTISVRLPLKLAITEAAVLDRDQRPDDDHALTGLRVLAADDNEINRLVLGNMLAVLDVKADIVDGGAAAIEAATAGDYDLLLLDISMPEVDGTQALAAIRAHEMATGAGAIPAIAVTAHAYADEVAAFAEAGFSRHLAKPMTLATLADALRNALRKSDAPKRLS